MYWNIGELSRWYNLIEERNQILFFSHWNWIEKPLLLLHSNEIQNQCQFHPEYKWIHVKSTIWWPEPVSCFHSPKTDNNGLEKNNAFSFAVQHNRIHGHLSKQQSSGERIQSNEASDTVFLPCVPWTKLHIGDLS